MDGTNSSFLIIGMVGLPARGKSYISRKMCRLLEWIGYPSKVFNIGNYRRANMGVHMDFEKFFDPNNEDSKKARDECAVLAMKDICDYFYRNEVRIAILDGTNTTIERRKMIQQYFKDNLLSSFNIIWVESICNLKDIIEKNVTETKLKSADYIDWADKQKAKEDFYNRISLYEKVYEPIDPVEEEEEKYVKIIDQGKKIILNKISGYLESKLVSYLANLHTQNRSIYFCRHGESEFNVKELLGGDPNLSVKGEKFPVGLARYFTKEFENSNNKPLLYCSTLKRTIQTCKILQKESNNLFENFIQLKILDEIDTGIRDGMTYKEIEENFPEEYQERLKDKLKYRYPRGESYKDVIERIEPMIYEIERLKTPVVIVGHQAVIRCLYGYFCGVKLSDVPSLIIPLHTVIKFVPKDHGYIEETYFIDTDNLESYPVHLNQEINEGIFFN